jgi:ADP-ribose pyrophosphatase
MGEVVQSAGGVVYFLEGGQPKFLLIKRQAMSKKIERVAPKGKIEPGEAVDEAALREISEEAGIPLNQLKIGPQIGVTQLRSDEEK